MKEQHSSHVYHVLIRGRKKIMSQTINICLPYNMTFRKIIYVSFINGRVDELKP